MTDVLGKLVELLSLERIEADFFRGQSEDLGWGVVFGGQVLGQAVAAAVQTVEPDRLIHSLHAYFLRPGDVSQPILYSVERVRDGKSFTTRRVAGIQSGYPIFILAASFHKPEPGLQHQDPMPVTPPPQSAPSEQDLYRRFSAGLPKPFGAHALAERPFEHRIVMGIPEGTDILAPKPRPPRSQVWFRAMHPLPNDPSLHAYLLAYASDHGFISTALAPHGVTWLSPGMQVASIDHVMWLHQPFRVDEWLLYNIDSPAAANARGLVRGQIFAQDGRLVASTAQEGLIRQHQPNVRPRTT